MALTAGDRDIVLRMIREAPVSTTDKRILSELIGNQFALTDTDKRAGYDHAVPKR